jgi:hypothetical protein
VKYYFQLSFHPKNKIKIGGGPGMFHYYLISAEYKKEKPFSYPPKPFKCIL